MLTAYSLDGSIMDIANTAALDLANRAAASSPPAPTPGSSSVTSPILTTMLDVARAQAEAEKRKATWLLVGVGLGALLVGVLVGRYAIPAKKKRG